MKIAHVIFSLNAGGAEAMLIDIANEQVKTEELTIIIINKHYSLELINQFDSRIKIELLNRKQGIINLFKIFQLNFKLFNNYHIIHCHNTNIAGMLIPFLFKKKLCLTIHDTIFEVRHLKRYNILFAISKTVQKEIYATLKLNSILVYNGIQIQDVKKRNIEINIPKEKIRLVQVGRLKHEKKGQDIAINAVHQLIKKGYPIELDFIGEGKSLNFLKELCSELKVEKNIHFLGLKDREYVYEHLCDYDILIQPSLYEGFGLTLIEAFAAGLRVVTSEIEGPKEIVKLLNAGSTFQLGDSSDCSLKIEEIIKNPSEYSIEFYVRLNSLFNIKETSLNYLENYK